MHFTCHLWKAFDVLLHFANTSEVYLQIHYFSCVFTQYGGGISDIDLKKLLRSLFLERKMLEVKWL